MNCNDIQKIIVTDYADNMLSYEDRKMIDVHLNNCSVCAQYKEALENALYPLKHVSSCMPSASVWNALQARIVPDKISMHERVWRTVHTSVLWTKEVLMVKHPLLACAALLVLVCVPPSIQRTIQQQIVVEYMNEHVTALSAFENADEDSTLGTDIQFGTVIEQVFM